MTALNTVKFFHWSFLTLKLLVVRINRLCFTDLSSYYDFLIRHDVKTQKLYSSSVQKLFVERVCRSSLTNSDHKVLVQLSFFDKLGLQPKCHKNKYIDTKKVWNLKCVNMLLNVLLHLYHALLRTSLNWFAVFSMIDNRLPDEQVIE